MNKKKLVLFSKILFYFINGFILLTLALFNLNNYIDEYEIITNELTVFILIISSFAKLVYWQLIRSNYFIATKNETFNFLFLAFFILTFVLPTYMVYQKSSLIIDELISKISFLLILFFTIFGVYIEKKLLFIQIKKFEDLKSMENEI